MKKLIVILVLAVFVGVGAVAAYVFHFVNGSGGISTEKQIFDLEPGSSFYAVAHDLENQGLIRNARVFSWYARILGLTTQVKVGEYELSPSMTPRQVLDVLSAGKSIERPITVPEGFNIFEIAEVIDKTWPGRGDEFKKITKDPVVVKSIIGRDAANLEGYLFPETYMVTKYTSTEALVKMMTHRFFEVYEKLKKEPKKLEMGLHNLVTFASIVEKETGVPEERRLIASVFQNRLQKGMKIQSDPTIIYGHWIATGEYLKNIQRKHILEANDYNTYAIKALPIGPISNPGEDALRAAMNPSDSEYLYFVSRNDGTHVFSKTLAEHNKAVKNFQLNPSARQGKSWRDRSL